MDIVAVVISILSVLFAGGAVWYARGEKLAAARSAEAAENSAASANRSADAAEQSARAAAKTVTIEQDRRADELAEAARNRVRWSLDHVVSHKYLLRNDGTDSAYGVHVDFGDLGISDAVTDFDEFPSGHAESYLVAISFGTTTDRLVVTWHDKPDRFDEPRRVELVVA